MHRRCFRFRSAALISHSKLPHTAVSHSSHCIEQNAMRVRCNAGAERVKLDRKDAERGDLPTYRSCSSSVAMASFDDDANPFRTDIDGEGNGPMERSVTDDEPYRPPSPPTPTQGLPPLPAKASSFPRAPDDFAAHLKDRTEFCCSKDRYLHLEDDAEILVRAAVRVSPLSLTVHRLSTRRRLRRGPRART